MNDVITDGRTLRAMHKRGFIVWQGGQVTRHWTGARIKVRFVEAGPKLQNYYDVFEYHGVAYRLRYLDGCFKPFVCRLDARNLPMT